MNKLLSSVSFSLFVTFSVFAQPDIQPDQFFDFWIGEWNLTWDDGDGTTGTGKNTITRILDDKVILENFEGLTGKNKGFIGKSWSVYSPQLQEWHQTWVDNQGGYLDFKGKFEGENRIFIRNFTAPNNNEIWQRMVFKDIKEDSFTWDWEVSQDGGNTWILRWRINYTRNGS